MTTKTAEQGLFWDDLVEDLKDPAFLREYIVESMRIATIDSVVNALDAAREAAGLTRADLARSIGAEPAVLRRLFGSGPVNPTLGTVAEVAASLGMRVTIEKLPITQRKVVTESLRTGKPGDVKVLAESLATVREPRTPDIGTG